MARFWTCTKCSVRWPRTISKCRTEGCSGRKPAPRKAQHQLVLETHPYEWWVERFGELCGICGRPPGPKRNLDRDHDHRTGQPRGLLCHRCNRALPNWMDVAWLVKAIGYLVRTKREADDAVV